MSVAEGPTFANHSEARMTRWRNPVRRRSPALYVGSAMAC